jgi:hypothetical protein
MKGNTLIRLRLNDPGFEPGRYNFYCFYLKHPDRPVPHPASCSVRTVLPVPRVHWQGRQADRSPPYSAEAVNVWNYTSTLSVRLYGV